MSMSMRWSLDNKAMSYRSVHDPVTMDVEQQSFGTHVAPEVEPEVDLGSAHAWPAIIPVMGVL